MGGSNLVDEGERDGERGLEPKKDHTKYILKTVLFVKVYYKNKRLKINTCPNYIMYD